MSDGSLLPAIRFGILKAGHIPRITAETRRLEAESLRTGKSIIELKTGTPATQKDMDDIAFGAQFNFPEVSG